MNNTPTIPPQGIVVAINKVWTKAEIKQKLATDKNWAIRGMLKIYEYQTTYEKSAEQTMENNGIGFSAHGEIFSSFVKQYLKYGRLSDKQMAIVFKGMPHYAGQLERIIKGKQ